MNGTVTNPLLAQLDDIKGLERVSCWPLAPGWWALLALVALASTISAALYLRRRVRERSWKGDAEKELSALEERLTDKTAQEVAATLSVTLRRIAMQRFSRSVCAGLSGHDWLQWLTQQDPKGFNWIDNGALLMETPYAPPGRTLRAESIKMLLQAAKEWVR